ncbi:hypothetical protein I3842_09G053500 [Carya illinoinensis]|uniref:Uncharacterized protein n=1 Tax=Carya illinoinensis TaxID=32201 RepID=A0A922E0T0_CARIL|nr:hypothetical protein I3842_09G053500 [Carya illinoinensis]
MGSLPSPPRPVTPPPSPENSTSNYQVFGSFCPRDQLPNTNRSNSIDSYNPSNNTWSHITSIPGLLENYVLKGFAMVSLRDSIYVIGGRLCHKETAQGSQDSDDYAEEDVKVLPVVLCFNVGSNQWSESCAPLGTPRYDFACSICENKMGLSSAEVYDPEPDIWAPLPNMSILRYKCVGVTWQGKFYVVGGFAEREDSDPGLFMVLRSSADVMWPLDVPPNQIVTMNGRLFRCGDCLNARKGHTEVYDGVNMIWNELDGSERALNVDWRQNQRLYLPMAPIGTHLYFLTGCRTAGDSSRTMSRVHVFDTSAAASKTWRSFEPMEEEGERAL